MGSGGHNVECEKEIRDHASKDFRIVLSISSMTSQDSLIDCTNERSGTACKFGDSQILDSGRFEITFFQPVDCDFRK